MSVLKRNRKASQFEVFHHLNKLRRDITDLLLRDFGYSFEKAEKRLERRFSGRSYEELTEMEKGVYDRLKKRWEAFDEWFIEDQRKIMGLCSQFAPKPDSNINAWIISCRKHCF